MKDVYESPLSSRYATKEMLKIFSPDTRYGLWRKLWLSLAKAEKSLGLDITDEQIAEMSEHLYDIDYECVKEREKVVKHDVMAHVYAFGKVAPKAAGIIHLGATSCFVTDNSDLVIYKSGLISLKTQLLRVMRDLSVFADKYKATPTLAYTHYQSAQFTTVGKRAAIWLYNFESDLKNLDFVIDNMKLLGSRGTTGTEASFLKLFDGDGEKVDRLNEAICKDFGFSSIVDVCGQTYPRKMDYEILSVLAGIAQSAYKFANDIRLLQHDGQIEEPFEEDQIGSSAMAYKRNPVKCERVCSLSRYIMSDIMNVQLTAANQWLERTLDDSANRRISMPEGFLCASAVLELLDYIASGLKVNLKMIEKFLEKETPFVATENLLMEAVKRGGDRQKLHEKIRKLSMQVTISVRDGGENDLIDRLLSEEEFAFAKDLKDSLLEAKNYVGRCPEQVEKYLKKLEPLFVDIDENHAKIDV
ncbi:MAG: adenylosuccinate lyase [Clostridia bacterium]|nr:adenylosuccinate lyase [Clostridia bacterium]